MPDAPEKRDLRLARAARAPIEVTVTAPFAGDEPTTTVAVETTHEGRSTAPVGEDIAEHELSVMVPVYPPLGLAVMVELPVPPGVSATALPERVYVPSSIPDPFSSTAWGEVSTLSVMLTNAS